MTTSHSDFQIGAYRPIYLWGGPGTIRMNRLKFMDQPVDEPAHHEVHTEVGARRVLEDMYCNWVHLMYNWGFPPEVERGDWEDFERATAIYHELGGQVFAYVQTSNCVYDGSFKEKDWYARDQQGKKVYYYSGRYMTCVSHPEWVAHLKEVIRGAIQRGADGVFFDNMWDGAMPLSLFDAWLGGAGCYCARCQAAYLEQSGESIPTHVDPNDPVVAHYLRWRANRLTALIAGLAAYVDQLRPGAPVSANDYDIAMRATYLVYGQDPRALARVKPVSMVENFALPRWDSGPKPRLANNALTIRNARALVRDAAHLSVLSYDVGIGFDGVYPPRRYQQGIAEAAACGASMTVKGTEYFHHGRHTVLTPEQFAPVHQAIGSYNRWLADNAPLYQGRENLAPLGLLYPGERLWLDWHRLAPLYLGAGQALLCEGLPWRVVNPGDDLSSLEALLVFDAAILNDLVIPAGVHVVLVPLLEGWRPAGRSPVERLPALRDLISKGAHNLMDAYFASKSVRRAIDALGVQKLITQTSLFYLRSERARASLLAALPLNLYPRVKAERPLLIEAWRQGQITQIHLLNYADAPQTAHLLFDDPVSGRAISPDFEGEWPVGGRVVNVEVDVYTVILV